MKSATINVLHQNKNERKYLPKDQRVQLSNKREEFFDTCRQEKVVQKIKSSPVSVPPFGK